MLKLVTPPLLTLMLCLFAVQAYSLTPAEAASQAQRQHGGKVLAVQSSGGNPPTYSVRLLLPGGKVITVTVR